MILVPSCKKRRYYRGYWLAYCYSILFAHV